MTIRKSPTGWQVIVDVAPPGQKRQQKSRTFSTKPEARAWKAQVLADRAKGLAIHARSDSFRAYVDAWLAAAKARISTDPKATGVIRPATYKGYVSASIFPVEYLGGIPVTELTRSDVEAMLAAMTDRRRAGSRKPRPVAARTKRMALFVVHGALERAVEDKRVLYNVATNVKAYGAKEEREPISVEEMGKIAKAAAEDRLHACWTLTLAGMRRSEVLGLLWGDVDLAQGLVHVRRGRTGYVKRQGDPLESLTGVKSEAGERSLPLGPDQVEAFRKWRTLLASEFGTGSVAETAFVAVDEAGIPIGPDEYSDEWRRLVRRAGITRKVLLHEARHGSVWLLRGADIPDVEIARWHGHTEDVMRKIYGTGGRTFRQAPASPEIAAKLLSIRAAAPVQDASI